VALAALVGGGFRALAARFAGRGSLTGRSRERGMDGGYPAERTRETGAAHRPGLSHDQLG
jgi:hypothetical protein